MTLATPLMPAYTSSGTDARAQIVRVEEIGTVIVSAGGSLTAPAWDGTTGGIMAIHADSLTIAVKDGISMVGKGYAGGLANGNEVTGGNAPMTVKTPGESYLKKPGGCVRFWNVHCPTLEGGGAGGLKHPTCSGTGGGGGGNLTAGSAGGSGGCGNGGAGGATYGDPKLAEIFFGSGGGSASSADSTHGSGGGGGGIVLVDSDTIVLSSAGAINAQGAPGAPESATKGGGGGGAGGSVYLTSKTVTSIENVTVSGGGGGTGSAAGGAGGWRHRPRRRGHALNARCRAETLRLTAVLRRYHWRGAAACHGRREDEQDCRPDHRRRDRVLQGEGRVLEP